MKVNSPARVANLNADQLDGQEASDLAEPRAYAHVTDEGTVDTAYPRKGVNGIMIPTGETSLYCFDLAFDDPKTAVGSPHLNNAAWVATATQDIDSNPGNDAVSLQCSAPHDDAAVHTYGSDALDAAINFQVVFE